MPVVHKTPLYHILIEYYLFHQTCSSPQNSNFLLILYFIIIKNGRNFLPPQPNRILFFYTYSPLRPYSRLNDFLNTCRKRKTAIGLTAVLLRLVSVRNTQYHSIQSHRHRLECYSSILSISSYPLLSVLPLHLASLPFPLSDIFVMLGAALHWFGMYLYVY